MKTFEYTAVDVAGRPITGRAWATNEVALDAELERSGVTLTRAQEVTGTARRRRKHRLKPWTLHQITTQLATVTSAGVPIVEGIGGIARRVDRPETKHLLEEIVADLEAGEGLSGAMARHPEAFPVVYRSSVEAGEAAGALETVLLRLARYLEWSQNMRSTTVQALIYPSILLCAILGLIGILLYFVLPRIVKIFPGGQADLPLQTRIVMGASDFMVENAAVIAVCAVIAIVGFVVALRRDGGREFLHGLALKLPKLGSVARQIATSRFASTASTLQAAGCDVFTMLRISGATCGNAAMAKSFARATESVRNGARIADALEREARVDSLLIQMVSVGERTGQLDGCLGRLVDYYDTEVPRAVKRFLSILEPLMLLFAGAVVTFILLAALLPIFQLYESL